MRYPKITTVSILLYCFGLTAGCIVAYFDVEYTRDLAKYDHLCFGVLITGALGLIAPFVRISDYLPATRKELVIKRVIAIVIGFVHFFFLKKLCTSSHPDNSYLAMRFYYFFVSWYVLTIFSPRVATEQKNVLA